MTSQTYDLILTLDIHQVTKSLQYEFTSDKGSPLHKEGPLAGTCNFNAGDMLNLKVIAKGDSTDDYKITVVDFTLVSISTLRPAEYFLSLFDQHNACTNVSKWGAADYKTSGKRTVAHISALDKLAITAPNGQWEMSGYLSVLIERNALSPAPGGGSAGVTPLRQTINRLFYFDPESSAGSGGDIRL